MENAQNHDDGESQERHQSQGAEDIAEDREEARLPGIVVVRHARSLSRRSFPRAADVSKDLFEKPEIPRFAQDDNAAFVRVTTRIRSDDHERSLGMTTDGNTAWGDNVAFVKPGILRLARDDS